MTAAMLVLEPIFEADLPPEQYAYSGASAQDRLVRPSVRPLQTQGGAYLFALADVLTHTAKHSLGSPRQVLLAFQMGEVHPKRSRDLRGPLWRLRHNTAQMACATSPLDVPLHPNLGVLAQRRGRLLRQAHKAPPQARRLPLPR